MPASHIEVILHHDGAELVRVSLPPGVYVIGRSPAVEISANTPLLSRRHALLTIADDRLYLEDLGSSNGTFVDDERITSSMLLSPDAPARLGDVTLQINRPLPAASALAGELLAGERYAIGAQVARGGMGAILDAEQAAMKRRVAMKVMLDTQSRDDAQRFIEEAQITGQLQHPNIVPVHELGVDPEGRLFYTMKMVRGITLQKVLDLLAQGIPETVKKYPLPALFTIFQKTCDALAFAHAKGVIHRDLKPENFMLGDFGEVLVMDWGLAKVVGRDTAEPHAGLRSSVATTFSAATDCGRTLCGTIMGTPAYMSPEQARAETELLDARSDIYSLGAILFEILHLHAPFTGKDPWEIIERVKLGRIEWPDPKVAAKKLPHLPGGRVPASLTAICRKALALDPGDRYARVGDLQRDLEAFQLGFATSAEKVTPLKSLALFARRNQPTVIAAALILAISLGLGTQAIVEGGRANRALTELRKTAPTFGVQATLLAGQHRFEEALTALGTACTLDPAKAGFHAQRGHLLQTLGRYDEAHAAFREALRREPMHGDARQNLALTEHLMRDSADGPEQARGAQLRLQAEQLRQGRTAEAVFLSRGLSLDGTRNYATWKPIVEKAGLKTGTHHFRTLPDGSLRLAIEDATFGDLRPLAGMPLGELAMPRTTVQDLAPLQSAPLQVLDVNGSARLRDLAGLRGLPLRELNISACGITDLGPLRGMKLTVLRHSVLQGNVRDGTPLAGMPLRILALEAHEETDLSFLSGMPLEDLTLYGHPRWDSAHVRSAPLARLHLEGRQVTDLAGLAGLPLRSLRLARTEVSDLTPLRGLPLTELRLEASQVADLSPLAGMPLKTLYLTGSKKITDLTPLATLTQLESLVLPEGSHELEPLRKLPHLKRLSQRVIASSGAPAQTAAEFWAENDAPKAEAK